MNFYSSQSIFSERFAGEVVSERGYQTILVSSIFPGRPIFLLLYHLKIDTMGEMQVKYKLIRYFEILTIFESS